MKLTIKKNEATIEGDDSLVSKLVAGCKGKITIKTPFGEREIKNVKDDKGKTIKEKV